MDIMANSSMEVTIASSIANCTFRVGREISKWFEIIRTTKEEFIIVYSFIVTWEIEQFVFRVILATERIKLY